MTTDAPYIDNTSVQGAMMAISANSAHPVEAMKFLNLLNTDPYVMTLLNYGVEGVHYNLNAEGMPQNGQQGDIALLQYVVAYDGMRLYVHN